MRNMYTGAYLCVKTISIEIKKTVKACPNEHDISGRRMSDRYCPQCGEELEDKTILVRKWPTLENFLGLEYEGMSQIFLPYEEEVEDEMIVIANDTYSGHLRDHNLRNITGEVIERSISELENTYLEQIELLRKEAVNVHVFFGVLERVD